ncbi:NAD(P)H-dependent quinone reductase [Staphylococcus aureus]|nr:NAD(P)H-dependent quinone reductase [Staphylococcus aureus]CXT53100.1 NAD(P)H-dependent quinone reductase [Staphylococcus aureus]
MSNMNQTIMDAFHFRHATKQFDPQKKVSKEDFETILESGRLSPSSLGLEPWKFVVIQDQALRDELKAHSWGAAKQLDTASHFVLIFARKNVTSRSPYVQHMLRDIKNMRHKRFQLLNKNSMHSKQIFIFPIMIKPCMIGQVNKRISH